MKKNLIILFVFMSLFSASAGFAQQAQSGEAVELLKENIDSVLAVLEEEQLSDDQKRQKIEQIVDPIFNYELMAMLSLGKNNWSKFSEQQRKTFIDRFVRRLKDSYFDKIALYQGDQDARVSYGESKTQGNKVHVPVAVRAKGSTVDMLYKFYPEKETWSIYDVEINGVSIVQSYRTQFNQILSRGSVDDLIDQLRTLEAPGVDEDQSR